LRGLFSRCRSFFLTDYVAYQNHMKYLTFLLAFAVVVGAQLRRKSGSFDPMDGQ
jgi:hypothetical protein